MSANGEMGLSNEASEEVRHAAQFLSKAAGKFLAASAHVAADGPNWAMAKDLMGMAGVAGDLARRAEKVGLGALQEFRATDVPSATGGRRTGTMSYNLNGTIVRTSSGKDTLIRAIEALERERPGFLDRWCENGRHGRTRRYVARRREDLYRKAHLMKYSHRLESGHWVGTNLSTNHIEQVLRIACEEAGFTWGVEFTVELQ